MVVESMKLRRSPHVAGHGLGNDEGGVLLHLRSGQYHGVNDVGWAIWNLLDRPRDVAELTAELRRQFPEAASIADDVQTFVSDLLARDLIELLTEGER